MEKYISEFPQHLSHAIEITAHIKISKIPQGSYTKIVMCGLGGSGIGATIVKSYVSDKSAYPVEVIKDYRIPAYVDDQTLVILCSYSGNTEETVSCLDQALKATSKIIIVTSGGRLLEIAQERNFDVFLMPPSFQPRAALGYSLVMLLNIFHQLGLVDHDINEEILQAKKFIEDHIDDIRSKAEELAAELNDRLPIIYTELMLEGIAVRWRQQMNENAKKMCFHHVLPEMNHNELVALKNGHSGIHFILLRHESESTRNKIRFEFCESKFREYGAQYTGIHARGNTYWERAFYLILTGDWLSYYLSRLQSVDAMEVEVINELKTFLSNK